MDKYYCKLCDRKFPSAEWQDNHTRTKRHIENMEKAKKEDFFEVVNDWIDSGDQKGSTGPTKQLYRCDSCKSVFMNKFNRDRHVKYSCPEKKPEPIEVKTTQEAEKPTEPTIEKPDVKEPEPKKPILDIKKPAAKKSFQAKIHKELKSRRMEILENARMKKAEKRQFDDELKLGQEMMVVKCKRTKPVMGTLMIPCKVFLK
jgi:hypothetical protein